MRYRSLMLVAIAVFSAAFLQACKPTNEPRSAYLTYLWPNRANAVIRIGQRVRASTETPFSHLVFNAAGAQLEIDTYGHIVFSDGLPAGAHQVISPDRFAAAISSLDRHGFFADATLTKRNVIAQNTKQTDSGFADAESHEADTHRATAERLPIRLTVSVYQDAWCYEWKQDLPFNETTAHLFKDLGTGIGDGYDELIQNYIMNRWPMSR
ncbi:MAG: hypothetical protein AAGF84_07165 [Planctomycetota bacterium]